MRLKMHQGTANSSRPSLCVSCRRAQNIRMAHTNEEVTYCHLFGEEHRVRGVVAECNMYDDKRQPSLAAMKEIAWHVTSDEKRGIGFISAKEWRARKKDNSDGDEAPLVTPGGDIYY